MAQTLQKVNTIKKAKVVGRGLFQTKKDLKERNLVEWFLIESWFEKKAVKDILKKIGGNKYFFN